MTTTATATPTAEPAPPTATAATGETAAPTAPTEPTEPTAPTVLSSPTSNPASPTATPQGNGNNGGNGDGNDDGNSSGDNSNRGEGGGSGSSPDVDPAIISEHSLLTTRVGDVVEFAFIITNNVGRAQNVAATSHLPPFLEPLQVTTTWGTTAVEGHTVTAAIGDLYGGDTVTVRVQARVTSHALPPHNIAIATVSSGNDQEESNNAAAFVFWTFAP
ncbi:MAG: hypothetical protein HC884_18615 [Chloroflexaceae bacterium]|nr:hypothetical protein [Chloroflexaceae bacterium]